MGRALAGSRTGDRLACLVATSSLIDTAYRRAIGISLSERLPVNDEIAAARGVEDGPCLPGRRRFRKIAEPFSVPGGGHLDRRLDPIVLILFQHSSGAETQLSTLLQGTADKPGDRCFA